MIFGYLVTRSLQWTLQWNIFEQFLLGVQMAYELADETRNLIDYPFRNKSTILKDSADTFLDTIIKPVHEVVAAVRF